MERLLQVMATVSIVSCARPMLKTRVALHATSLSSAYWWGSAALLLWAATSLATELSGFARDGLADQLWYASAVALVSPFAAALGARRPASRIWSWFVVLPATIVLFLPAVTAWKREGGAAPLDLELPMMAGYGLVLLMGAGNYLGTRFGLSALLAAAAALCVVLSMSELAPRLNIERAVARPTATILLALAVWRAAFRLGSGSTARGRLRFDRIWLDFRDLFGIVWARRIADRINQAAAQGSWPVRLLAFGFVPIDPQGPGLNAEQSAQVEQTLRWLLRRFVDPEWIDERLNDAK
jgi:hypothetical protein